LMFVEMIQGGNPEEVGGPLIFAVPVFAVIQIRKYLRNDWTR